ncbi:MAG: hypothetical protein NTX17_08055 [Candidatus Eisenbacteria bacterium]|nr:hypothetical protein [Candidatus Eisenbacteria bacterium]
MNRFRLVLIVALAITAVLLATVAFPVWAGCSKACGTSCGSKSSACPMQGTSVTGKTQGGSTTCPMQGTSTAGKAQGVSAASAVGQVQGSSCFLASYFEMRSLLAQDKMKGLDKLSKTLAGETGKFRKGLASSSKNGALAGQITALKDIEKAASAMKTGSLESARESFKGLSRSVLAYVKSYGCSAPVYSFYCDMAKESWLQDTNTIGNPYYGSKMLKCGVMIGRTENGKYVAGKHE